MALLPALLLQPAFSRALRAKPVWTHYLHYVAFLGAYLCIYVYMCVTICVLLCVYGYIATSFTSRAYI